MATFADDTLLEVRIPLEDLIAGLSRPEAFGLDAGVVEVAQTHISVVFLAGDRAYKVKKPTRLWGLVDYGTVDLRRHWCEEEVRLNRRLAPDVYLGVEPIVRRDGALFVGGEGEVLEHAVVMRRIDERQTLAARLARGEAGEADVQAVARLLARFHAANRLPAPEAGAPSLVDRVVRAFVRVCWQNFQGTPIEGNPLFPETAHARLRVDFGKRLGAAYDKIIDRVARGLAVDGHGDIRLDHVLWTERGWIIMDCCEFAEVLRHVDPLSDMAFLSMDLRAKGHAGLARTFEAAYMEAADERDVDARLTLLPLYRAYRAFVRATVAYHTTRRPELAPEIRTLKTARARGYFTLCWTEVRRPDPLPLLVMRGTSGTGKSHVAGTIAPYLDAEIVRSDVVRKELLGLAPTDRPDDEAKGTVYSSAVSAQTYAELLVRARAAIDAGRSAILDATYLRHDSRAEAVRVARELGAPVAVIEVWCPPDVVRERLAARAAKGDDASDADWAVYEMQVASDEPLTDAERSLAVRHDTRDDPHELLVSLLAALDRQLAEVEA
ncbi:MAG: AAA family ATPase [Planctomycetota bacterium]|nr:AAA family ATPase [Planctomycetota bacterium]